MMFLQFSNIPWKSTSSTAGASRSPVNLIAFISPEHEVRVPKAAQCGVRQANVAIHNRSFACSTMPQTRDE